MSGFLLFGLGCLVGAVAMLFGGGIYRDLRCPVQGCTERKHRLDHDSEGATDGIDPA